ncbi:hypothetical protein [Stutzerimonas xanthomarina]|uniref:hypothetical protein n=1 Tax=Stutzerimonas xanthomarina TaxID=271420 RepID=UPI003AA87AB5
MALIPFATFSVSSSLSRIATEKTNNELNIAIASSLRIIFLASIVSTLLFYLFSPKELTPTIPGLFIVMLGFCAQGLIAISSGTSIAKLNFKKASKIENADAAIKLMVCASLLYCFGLSSVELFYLYISSSVFTLIFVDRSIFLSLNLTQNIRQLAVVIKGCAGYTFCSAVILFYFYLIRSTLFELDKGLAAHIDFAIMFYSIPKMAMSAMSRSIIPIVASKGIGVVAAKKEILITGVVGLVASVCLYVAASSSFVAWFFNIMQIPDFSYSILPLSIIMAGAVFDLIFGLISGANFARGKQNITLIACSLSVLLVLPFIKEIIFSYGIVGASLLIVAIYPIFLIFILLVEEVCKFFVRYS